jgi:hypothetical protein
MSVGKTARPTDLHRDRLALTHGAAVLVDERGFAVARARSPRLSRLDQMRSVLGDRFHP